MFIKCRKISTSNKIQPFPPSRILIPLLIDVITQDCKINKVRRRNKYSFVSPGICSNDFKLARSVMENLQHLRPFVWFCHLSGFIPFRMRIDPETKFQRFTFSFRHPLTWWFFVSKIIFLVFLYVFLNSMLPTLLLTLNAKEISLRALSFQSQVIFQIGILTTIQCIVLRCSHLRKAIELIQKADETLKSLPHTVVQKDTVIRRTLIGVVASITLVKIFNCFLLIHF